MTIQELREKRNAAWNACKAFLEARRTDSGVLSAEDDATYTRMEQEVTDLGKEISRLERQEAMDAELSRPVNTPLLTAPQRSGDSKPQTGRASNAYREDFRAFLMGRSMIHNVLSEGVDANGGYLVPVEFERQIVSALDEANVIRSLAHVITTQAERKIPVASTHAVAQWTAENAAYGESNPTFGQTNIDAFKLTCLSRISIELLQDSMFDMESYIAAEHGRAFGIAEEEAFCIGGGPQAEDASSVSRPQPTGIFTANGGTVGVTANSASAIAADELIDLVYALKSPYRRNAVWLMNDATVSLIRKLKDSNDAYLWQPSLQAGEPDRLLGYPLYTSPYVPTVAASALTVAFGDFKNYWIADRAGRTVQRLSEKYADYGQIGFIATERVDGKVILSEGIQLLQMAAAAGGGSSGSGGDSSGGSTGG